MPLRGSPLRGGLAGWRRARAPAAPAAAPTELGETWVIEAPGRSGAASVAARLGEPFRRLPPDRAGLRAARAVGRPGLVLSEGLRGAMSALALRAAPGARLVHCGGGPTALLAQAGFDAVLVPEEGSAAAPGFVSDHRLPVLGPLHGLSTFDLARARLVWRERLAHLQRPRVVLLAGDASGAELPPEPLHRLARKVAALAASRGGSVLARTGAIGDEAGDAVAAGLSRSLHLLHRLAEPGTDPLLGLLGLADAIVVVALPAPVLSLACLADAPVFAALPELAGAAERRLLRGLVRRDQLRPLDDSIAPWTRRPLDEAGRIALALHRRFGTP